MRRLASIPTIIFQISITFLALFVITIVFFETKIPAVTRIASEPASELHKKFFVSIWTLIGMGICFVIGLPIRLILKLKNWWTSRPVINVIGLFVGLYLLFSNQILFPFSVYISDILLAVEDSDVRPGEMFAGWFLVAFSLLHLYPTSFLKPNRRANADRLKVSS